jgi:hypothetical protein
MARGDRDCGGDGADTRASAGRRNALCGRDEDPKAFTEYLAEGRHWDELSADGLPDAREEFPEYNP